MTPTETVRRLPRFGVVDGAVTPHHKGTMVRLDDVLRALTEAPPSESLDEAWDNAPNCRFCRAEAVVLHADDCPDPSYLAARLTESGET